MNRRGFLQLGLGIMVAPAIIRADSLMRVIPWDKPILTEASLEQTIMELMLYIEDRGEKIGLEPTRIFWSGVRACAAYNYDEASNRLTEFKDYWK